MRSNNLIKLSIMILSALVGSMAYAQEAKIDTLTMQATPLHSKSDLPSTPERDNILTQSIKSEINKSATLSKLNVDVQTHKGVVSFSGKVESDSQASLLVELAQSIVGVKDVKISHLAIADSQQPFKDMLITAKIKGLLIREDVFGTKDIASINLTVETKNGIVYLTGAVDNKEQINNAIKIIRGVKGVSKVEYNVKKVVPNESHGM